MQDIVQKFRFQNTAVVLNALKVMMAAFQSPGFQTGFDPKEKSPNSLVFNDKLAYPEHCISD